MNIPPYGVEHVKETCLTFNLAHEEGRMKNGNIATDHRQFPSCLMPAHGHGADPPQVYQNWNQRGSKGETAVLQHQTFCRVTPMSCCTFRLLRCWDFGRVCTSCPGNNFATTKFLTLMVLYICVFNKWYVDLINNRWVSIQSIPAQGANLLPRASQVSSGREKV